VNVTGRKQREFCVLIGSSEPAIEECLRVLISHILKEERARFTVKGRHGDLREAMTMHRYDLVVLYINTIMSGVGRVRFDWALELIRQARRHKETLVIVIASFRPRGFASAAEQAGADAIVDAPFTVAEIEKAIRTPMEARS
jgi:DNA-binding NarL/FixJ family response regulator